MRRALLAGLIAGLALMSLPGLAAASCPSFDGVMTFPSIHGPEDPEEFCWEVSLFESQELRQVDETHAAVYYTESEHLAFEIEAEAAHDAEGTAVPTTLAVTAPNLITLTVHHRAGNPLVGGAPFDYLVTAGVGWEGGFESVEIKGPPDELELKQKPSPQGEEAPAVSCIVPSLEGRSLKAARRALRHADCHLGPVHGDRSRGARVVRQYRAVGKALPAGTGVGVRLG